MDAAAKAYEEGWISGSGAASERSRRNPYGYGTLEHAAFRAGRNERKEDEDDHCVTSDVRVANEARDKSALFGSHSCEASSDPLQSLAPCPRCGSKSLMPYFRGVDAGGAPLKMTDEEWVTISQFHLSGCPLIKSKGNPFWDETDEEAARG